MTTTERIQEDIDQLEYLRKWKYKKEARKVYLRFMKSSIKSAWYWLRAYLKGAMSE